MPTIWKLSRWPNTRSAQLAQRLDAGLDDDQRAEGEREHEQQVAVGMEDRLVDHELDLERCGEGGDLQRDRQQQHLRQAPQRSRHLRPQARELDRRRAVIGWKPGDGMSSSTTPVKCLETSASGKRAHADGRIVDDGLVALTDFSTTK